ncbi:hypothetical protein RRG08_022298 [Elysia crispata]|uniref:Uncharacterized protein n=1 Tax=Elysia crispata TaxID=231223 RepID=A0AAE0ZQ99_9GAST|nr:hypothetical protein RRG08_022298 [Elysia crispata]
MGPVDLHTLMGIPQNYVEVCLPSGRILFTGGRTPLICAVGEDEAIRALLLELKPGMRRMPKRPSSNYLKVKLMEGSVIIVNNSCWCCCPGDSHCPPNGQSVNNTVDM